MESATDGGGILLLLLPFWNDRYFCLHMCWGKKKNEKGGHTQRGKKDAQSQHKHRDQTGMIFPASGPECLG